MNQLLEWDPLTVSSPKPTCRVAIGCRFTGPAVLRNANRYEEVMPELTAHGERLQALLCSPVAARGRWTR